jgi:hypothetical protein
MKGILLRESGVRNRGRSFPLFPARFVAVAALTLMVMAGAASADPVRIVTSGSVFQLVEDGETGFGLLGAGFQVNGEVSSRPAQTCGPCIPGTPINLSATMTPLLFPPGSASIDGQIFESVFFDGLFNFAAGAVIVPDVPVGQDGIFPDTSFTFTGTLSGFSDISLTGPPLFALTLAGRGTASHGFFNFPSNNGSISRDGFNYEFESTAPVPEPGSILLTVSGAAWLASRFRRRQRRSPGGPR